VTPGSCGVPVPGKGVCDLSYGRGRVYSKRDDSRRFHRCQVRGLQSLGASCLLARAGKDLAWHRPGARLWSATRRVRGRKYPVQFRGHRRCSTGNERGTVIATLPAGHFLPKPEYVLPKPEYGRHLVLWPPTRELRLIIPSPVKVLLCGFSDLSGPERTLFVQHVMNEKNWARERKERKPPVTVPHRCASKNDPAPFPLC
jgi:hypothetical protein